MAITRALPVIMPNVPGQRWSCHSCGDCCRTLVGHLFDEERSSIDDQGWREKLGMVPYVRAGGGWVLNKHANGACVFLTEDNRCRIHAEFGEAAKPLACRVFPFSIRRTPAGWQTSLRFDCPSVIGSKGQPLGGHRASLARLAVALAGHEPSRADRVSLAGRLAATDDEIDALTGRLLQWIRVDDGSLMQRLFGAARVTTTLANATLKNVRGPRFVELVQLLFDALPGELHVPVGAPSPKQCGMFRQLVFAHAEHVTLGQLRSGLFSRFKMRLGQLRSARCFRRGVGAMPSTPGLPHDLTFEQVVRVAPARDDAGTIDELLQRYVTARLSARSVFGDGYYGWSAMAGLSALWLSIAAVGFLSRCFAAGASRSHVTLEDAGKALGIVDRAATRVPALGTMAEKARVSYLRRDDGIARLLGLFALTDPADHHDYSGTGKAD